MKKYTTLLFDADRTLFDFNLAEYNAVKKLCEYVGIKFSDEVHAVYSRINDTLWKQFEKKEVTREFLQTARFERFLNEMGKSGNPALLNGVYLDFLAQGNYLLPDAYDVCRELCRKYGSENMAIVTNGLVRAQTKRFNESDIAPFFSNIFISEQIGCQKPDKRYFDFVLSSLNITDKSKVLVIGDSLSSDILGAQNAGLDSCWFNPENAECILSSQPTYTISALTELLNIL